MSLTLGLTLGLTGSIVGGGASTPDPVTDPASGSIKFPQLNFVDADDRAGGAILTVNASQMSGSGEEILKPTDFGALGIVVDMNWMRTRQASSQVNYLIGTSGETSTTASRQFKIRYGGLDGDNIIGNFGIQFNAKGESANEGVTLAIDLSSHTDEGRIFLVVRHYDSAALGGAADTIALEAYSCEDGSLLDSDTYAFSTWAGNRTRNYFPIGGICNGTTGALVKSGNNVGFNGSVSLFFIYDGGTEVSTANCQSIALGASITATLGTGNFRMAYDWSHPTTGLDTPISSAEHTDHGAKPSPMVATASSSASLGIGSTLRRQTTSEYLTIDHIHDGKIFGVAPGATSANIAISGKCSENGETIQARIYATSDGAVASDWADVGVVSGGAFTGTISANLTNGWAYIDARVKSDPSNANLLAYHRLRTGVGYKVAVLGQSQMDILFDSVQTSGGLSLSGEKTVSYWGLVDKNAAGARPYCEIVEDEAQLLSSGLIALAEYLDSLTTAPVQLIGHHEQGTAMSEWADDSDSNRKFSESETLAVDAGSDTTAVLHQWGTSDAGSGTNYEENILNPVMLGSDPGGLSYTLNHSVLNSPDVGDDVFASTSRLIMCPLTRHGINTGNNPASPYDESEPSAETTIDSYRQLRQELVSFVDSNSEAVIGTWFNDIVSDTNDRGPHQALDDVRGNPRLGLRMAQSITKGLGIETIANPEVQSASRSGDTITVTISLPNSGTLVAGATQTSGSVPGGEDAVQGFEVSEDSGSTWSRSGFTASIASAANGTVSLVRDSSTFPANTLVRYAFGGPVAFDASYEDIVEGLLYEARGTEGTRGVTTAIEVGIPVAGATQVTAA